MTSVATLIVVAFTVLLVIDSRNGDVRLLQLRARSFTVLAVSIALRLMRILAASHLALFPATVFYCGVLLMALSSGDTLALQVVALAFLVVWPIAGMVVARSFLRTAELKSRLHASRSQVTQALPDLLTQRAWRAFHWSCLELTLYRAAPLRWAGQPGLSNVLMKQSFLAIGLWVPLLGTLISVGTVFFLAPSLYSNAVDARDLSAARLDAAWFFGSAAVTAVVLVEGSEWLRAHVTRTPTRGFLHVVLSLVLLELTTRFDFEGAMAPNQPALNSEAAGLIVGVYIGLSLALIQDLAVAAFATIARMIDRAPIDPPHWSKPMNEWTRKLSLSPGLVTVASPSQHDRASWHFFMPQSTHEPDAIAERLLEHLYKRVPAASRCSTALSWNRTSERSGFVPNEYERAWDLTITVSGATLTVGDYEATRDLMRTYIARPWRQPGWTNANAFAYLRMLIDYRDAPPSPLNNRGLSRTRTYAFSPADEPATTFHLTLHSSKGLHSSTWLYVIEPPASSDHEEVQQPPTESAAPATTPLPDSGAPVPR